MELEKELKKRHTNKAMTLNFIQVMKKVTQTNDAFIYSRLQKRPAEQGPASNKRPRTMDTSTPEQTWSYRRHDIIPDEPSPILGETLGESTTLDPVTSPLQSKDTFRKAGEARNKTNLSGGLDNTKLTPA